MNGYESFNASDRITGSVAISASTIDVPSSSTATTITIIPQEVMEQPEEQRDMTASKLVIENIQFFGGDEEEAEKVANIVKNIIEKKSETEIYKKDNQVVVFNNCNFYGSAIGGDAHKVDMTFIEVWNSLRQTIDMEALKHDLITLRTELSKKAKTDDEYKALSQVSMAFEDLKNANGPGMLKRIRNSGEWVFGVAKDIGVSVLADLIKRHMM